MGKRTKDRPGRSGPVARHHVCLKEDSRDDVFIVPESSVSESFRSLFCGTIDECWRYLETYKQKLAVVPPEPKRRTPSSLDPTVKLRLGGRSCLPKFMFEDFSRDGDD